MDTMPSVITESSQSIFRLAKIDFKEVPITNKICLDLRKLYEDFRPYLPLVVALKNSDMQPRHYEIIENEHDFEILHDLSESLKTL